MAVDRPVVLFGYDSSPFTQKVRLSLRLKQIPYYFIPVPSMMPRPLLRSTFNVTYRKIPILAIGNDIYCDTSIIIEALEHFFSSPQYQSLYPSAADGRNYRPLIRGFASYWTDRPFFRVATGLIPSTVWRTRFGEDRAGLIGHRLDADKLEAKVPRNLSNLDLHLSVLEPLFAEGQEWIFSTSVPSLADISLYYQLSWGADIAAGRGVENLTGGGAGDTNNKGATEVWNDERYPGLSRWFKRFERYIEGLPSTETRMTDFEGNVMPRLQNSLEAQYSLSLLSTPKSQHEQLDHRNGLLPGRMVTVAPDDTGRNDPTRGELVALSPEEIVIKPVALEEPAKVKDVKIHFPRLGFVVLPVKESKL